MHSINHFLKKDIPYLYSWKNKVLHIGLTLLLSLFIVFGLNAFNMRYWTDTPQWISFLGLYGFFVVGILSVLVLHPLYQFLFKTQALKLWQLPLWLLLELLLLSTVLTFIYDANAASYFNAWVYTFQSTAMVLFLPYTTSLLVLHSTASGKLKKENKKATKPEALIHFSDERNQVKFSVKKDQVLYLESSDNYITIYYFADHKVKKELLRNTLKRMELLLNDKGFIRCHRSYIVNIENMETLKKANRSYQIKMKYIELPLPASKSFVPKLMELIEAS